MDTKRRFWWVLLFILLLRTSPALADPNIPCDQVHAAARIARAKSPKALTEERAKVTGGYIIEVAAAFRAFELEPGNRLAAAGLLMKIPYDDAQQGVTSVLDSAMCDSEPDAEMEALAGIKYGLPRMLARAVSLVPRYMDAYVRYSLLAAPNPHTDYAIQMQRVCRNLHSEFIKAVEALPKSDREWFVKSILDPKRCRAIAIPESD